MIILWSHPSEEPRNIQAEHLEKKLIFFLGNILETSVNSSSLNVVCVLLLSSRDFSFPIYWLPSFLFHLFLLTYFTSLFGSTDSSNYMSEWEGQYFLLLKMTYPVLTLDGEFKCLSCGLEIIFLQNSECTAFLSLL